MAEQERVAKPAKSPKLKVYRTPIGFHDAYVAAPSQKVALAAWGSDANLFARGIAEEVTDPALTEAPLAEPGTVIKRLRGTVAEQLATLPPDAPRRSRAADAPAPKADIPAAPKPKPDRAALDAAERALAAAERRHRADSKKLAEREAELARERRALADHQQAETAALEDTLDRARAAYDKALAAWRT